MTLLAGCYLLSLVHEPAQFGDYWCTVFVLGGSTDYLLSQLMRTPPPLCLNFTQSSVQSNNRLSLSIHTSRNLIPALIISCLDFQHLFLWPWQRMHSIQHGRYRSVAVLVLFLPPYPSDWEVRPRSSKLYKQLTLKSVGVRPLISLGV